MHRDVHTIRVSIGVLLLGSVLMAAGVSAAQQGSSKPAPPAGNGASKSTPADEYVIGANDVLTISLFGQDPKYSGDFTVRPDGKITLLLVDEIPAAGFTPIQLKGELTKAYSRYFKDPVILVSPKQINSRLVYIQGQVFKPGSYPITDAMDITQLIALAGGLQDWADRENIVLIRKDLLPNGRPERIFFNYNKVFEKGSLDTIPKLRPGDQVFVK
jgi:polysaccharide biosynthesis/export protein